MKPNITNILNKIAKAEKEVIGTEFVAPLLGVGQRHIAVRVAGLIRLLAMPAGLPRAFRGWALLRVTEAGCSFVRPAALDETHAFLARLRKVRLVLTEPADQGWRACLAQQPRDMNFAGDVPVLFPEEGLERFEIIDAGFDGRLLWYKQRSRTGNPMRAEYLRTQLAADAADVKIKGITPEEVQAYAWVRQSRVEAQRAQEEARKTAAAAVHAEQLQLVRATAEGRLSQALSSAGAELSSYNERSGAYAVSYTVDGQSYTSVVERDSLSVITAGICLSGHDRDFDLTSLVHVLREGRARRVIHHTGIDRDYDDDDD